MRIILFRHGPAGSPDPARWPDDSRRPLTARGADRTRRAVRGLVRTESDIQAILTSPYARAEETARIVAEIAGAKVEQLEALVPGGSLRKMLEGLAPFTDNDTVVLVGHEPSLGKHAASLVSGAGGALPLKKAGACAIRFEGPPRPGAGHLEWLVTPRILRRAGRVKTHV